VTEFQTCFETSISERILSHLIVNAIDDPEFLGGYETTADYIAIGTFSPQAAIE
jgi:hypothetical protein